MTGFERGLPEAGARWAAPEWRFHPEPAFRQGINKPENGKRDADQTSIKPGLNRQAKDPKISENYIRSADPRGQP